MLNKRIAKARGFRGSKKATRALRYVLDGSASPMETLLVALLCLPSELGGYGLPLPRLNLVLDAGKVDSQGFRHRACDLSWLEYGLAVEYDSATFHSGTKPIERGSKRLVTLGLMNLHVESLTKGQVFDAHEFDRAARLLARRMRKRMGTRVPDIMTRRYCLRKELFAYSFGSPRFLSEQGGSQ